MLYPLQTYQAFRLLGFGLLMASIGTALIHLFFSYPTLDHWWPDWQLPVYLQNIHRCTHGSDSGVYDHDG